MNDDGVFWMPANEFIARQTKQIAKEFKTSRPRPRNRAMGFKGSDRKPKVIYR